METLLYELLKLALDNGVSDIHLQIINDELLIQLRKNKKIERLTDSKYDTKFFKYLQYKSNMDVTNSIAPQTGQFEYEVDDIKLSLRFAVIYSFSVTSGVLRLLNQVSNIHFMSLSKDYDTLEKIARNIKKETGLILFSGPTGSGKTTTIYTCLRSVNNRKVFTIEDPIEVYDHNFIQLQVNEAQNLSYEEGIKQLMRHDPDIIMIGEIRDKKAADGAVRSALTGHLVMATIHASSCAQAIDRMLELGINETYLKDVLIMVSNQRLVSTEGNLHGVYEIYETDEIEEYFNT